MLPWSSAEPAPELMPVPFKEAMAPADVQTEVSCEDSMEIEGIEVWKDIRERVVAKRPLVVLRTLPTTVDDLGDEFDLFLEDEDPHQVLDILGEPLLVGVDPLDAAREALQRLAAGKRRFTGARKERVAEMVLRFFDAWAARGDDPGAVVAGRIIAAGRCELATWEFDSGYPGSGQVIRAYRFQRSVIAISNDYGVCGWYDSLRAALRREGAGDDEDSLNDDASSKASGLVSSGQHGSPRSEQQRRQETPGPRRAEETPEEPWRPAFGAETLQLRRAALTS